MSTRRNMLVAAGSAAAMCWAVPAAADDAPGAAAGDAAMTCEQIAAELAPYMRPIPQAPARAFSLASSRGKTRRALPS